MGKLDQKQLTLSIKNRFARLVSSSSRPSREPAAVQEELVALDKEEPSRRSE